MFFFFFRTTVTSENISNLSRASIIKFWIHSRKDICFVNIGGKQPTPFFFPSFHARERFVHADLIASIFFRFEDSLAYKCDSTSCEEKSSLIVMQPDALCGLTHELFKFFDSLVTAGRKWTIFLRFIYRNFESIIGESTHENGQKFIFFSFYIKRRKGSGKKGRK